MKIKLHVTIVWLLLNIIISLVANYVLHLEGKNLGLFFSFGNVIICFLAYMCVIVEDSSSFTIFEIKNTRNEKQ